MGYLFNVAGLLTVGDGWGPAGGEQPRFGHSLITTWLFFGHRFGFEKLIISYEGKH